MTGGGRCVEEFPNNMAFLVEEGFWVEIACVGEGGTSDEEEVVEEGFSGKGGFSRGGVLSKEDLEDRKSAFDSMPLIF